MTGVPSSARTLNTDGYWKPTRLVCRLALDTEKHRSFSISVFVHSREARGTFDSSKSSRRAHGVGSVDPHNAG